MSVRRFKGRHPVGAAVPAPTPPSAAPGGKPADLPARKAPAVDWIGLYLQEDIGRGDITSEPLFDATHQGSARLVARERLLVAGVVHAADVFARLGARPTVLAKDGEWVDAGRVLLRVAGPTRAILAGERLALNLVARMAGIATQTRLLMEGLARACSAASVAGTRKTTPGFRAFEKEAIRIGGGDPHRTGLFDAVLLKDNHLAAAGSVASAVQRAKAANPGIPVECEVESLEDARAAVAAGADWLLIDNQTPEVGKAWADAVWKDHPDVRIEASGGITPETLTSYGWADRISLGWLTQRTPAKDLGLDWDEAASPGGKSNP